MTSEELNPALALVWRRMCEDLAAASGPSILRNTIRQCLERRDGAEDPDGWSPGQWNHAASICAEILLELQVAATFVADVEEWLAGVRIPAPGGIILDDVEEVDEEEDSGGTVGYA